MYLLLETGAFIPTFKDGLKQGKIQDVICIIHYVYVPVYREVCTNNCGYCKTKGISV